MPSDRTRRRFVLPILISAVVSLSTIGGAQDGIAPPFDPPGKLIDVGGWRLHLNEPPRDKLPLEAQRMRTWALGQVGHVVAGVNPFEHEELAELRADRAKTEYALGDMPLVVLTCGIPEEQGANGPALEQEHRRDHAAVAALSRHGKLVIATHSGQHVQLDEPQLAVTTIQQVVAATRK